MKISVLIAGVIGIFFAGGIIKRMSSGNSFYRQLKAATERKERAKKRRIVLAFVFVGVLISAPVAIGLLTYNTMVDAQENVKEKWSGVKAEYQRRGDLIPAIVSTVKGYAEYEQPTIMAVTEARTKAGQVSFPETTDPEAIEKWEKSQASLWSSLSRLIVTYENYPDLKADKSFAKLIDELKDTENRVSEERKAYNLAARDYNSIIRKLPQVTVAWAMGFHKVEYYQGDLNNQAIPEVQFKSTP